MVSCVPYPELTGRSLMYPWLRHVIFQCYFHVSDNLGERSTPSDHVAVRIVGVESDKSKSSGVRVGCPNILLFFEKDQ